MQHFLGSFWSVDPISSSRISGWRGSSRGFKKEKRRPCKRPASRSLGPFDFCSSWVAMFRSHFAHMFLDDFWDVVESCLEWWKANNWHLAHRWVPQAIAVVGEAAAELFEPYYDHVLSLRYKHGVEDTQKQPTWSHSDLSGVEHSRKSLRWLLFGMLRLWLKDTTIILPLFYLIFAPVFRIFSHVHIINYHFPPSFSSPFHSTSIFNVVVTRRPVLKQLIATSGDQHQSLRGKAFECASLLGEAVGKEPLPWVGAGVRYGEKWKYVMVDELKPIIFVGIAIVFFGMFSCNCMLFH